MTAHLEQNSAGDWLLGGYLLHPAEAPLEAATRDLQRLLAQAGPDDLVVLAGLGQGWHAQAIKNASNHPRLVAFDPAAIGSENQARHGPRLGWLDIAADLNQLNELISQHVVYAPSRRVAVFAAPAYRQALPEMVQQVRELVAQILSRKAVDAQTKARKNLLWASLAAANMSTILATPDAAGLSGAFKGTPAFVIGAGPSLSQSLPALALAQRKGLLLCAASALGPMAAAGIAPHCAVAIEAKDESRQFIGENLAETLLVAASTSNPRHFAAWPGPIAHAHLLPWLAEACASMAVPTGGHATSLAFSLAYLWGCDPIILVGQDLAYSGGKVHAQGRPGGDEDGVQGLLRTPAIGGGTVLTSPTFHSYISWYQESAGYLSRKENPVSVINCTAEGALINGLPHRHMLDLLPQFDDISVEYSEFIAPVMAGPRPDRRTTRDNLRRLRAQVTTALTSLQKHGPEVLCAPGQPAIVAYALEASDPDRGDEQAALKLMLQHLSEAVEACRG